jgi:hypothetical protein
LTNKRYNLKDITYRWRDIKIHMTITFFDDVALGRNKLKNKKKTIVLSCTALPKLKSEFLNKLSLINCMYTIFPCWSCLSYFKYLSHLFLKEFSKVKPIYTFAFYSRTCKWRKTKTKTFYLFSYILCICVTSDDTQSIKLNFKKQHYYACNVKMCTIFDSWKYDWFLWT